ncbi:MAG: hypothetical protein WA957_06105 [Alteraurantiacibacter sp.]
MAVIPVLIVLVAVVLFMQARKRGDTRQAATMRKIAMGLGIIAIALAVFGAFDIGQDNNASRAALDADGQV